MACLSPSYRDGCHGQTSTALARMTGESAAFWRPWIPFSHNEFVDATMPPSLRGIEQGLTLDVVIVKDSPEYP